MLSAHSGRLRTHLARKGIAVVVLMETDIALFSTVSLVILIVACIAITVEGAVLWLRR